MNLALVLSAALAAAASAPTTHVEGIVRDAAGAPVAGASVSVEGAGDKAEAATDAAGRFAVEWAGPRTVMVTAEAAGFPRTRIAAFVGDAPIEVVLTPAAFRDRVTVT